MRRRGEDRRRQSAESEQGVRPRHRQRFSPAPTENESEGNIEYSIIRGLGASATVLYLMVYMAMNLCAFAVITAVQQSGSEDDDISAFAGLGTRAPWLAWPMMPA